LGLEPAAVPPIIDDEERSPSDPNWSSDIDSNALENKSILTLNSYW
jgi:hypothetical protein